MIVKQYNHYVLELKEHLMQIINTKGKFLVVADTGGGKTYAILTIFKELSRLNTNKVYVIACPNRSQNEQNEKQYGVYAVIGGKKIKDDVSVVSMVYDKATDIEDYIRKSKKELVLVIDEAHQIIDSCVFREKALQHLNELESISSTVIHVTATPEKLYHLYKYDKVYVFKPNIPKTNIEEHSLVILKDNNIIAQLMEYIKMVKKKSNKTQLIFLNDLESIKKCYKKLMSEGFTVCVLANKDRLKEKFDLNIYPNLIKDREHILKGIRGEAKFPDGYDFIFSTDILECGVNLLNKNIILISTIFSPFDVDGGKSKQKTSRPREKIETALTITREIEESKKIKCKKSVFRQVEYTVKKYQRQYQDVFNFHIEKFGLRTATNHMQSILKSDINKSLYYGTLEVKEDKIIINPVTLVQAEFREYNKQFYYNHEELNNLLKKNVKADKFSIIEEDDLVEEETREKLKIINKEIKEEKDKIKEKAVETLEVLQKSETGLPYLREYIKDTDILKDITKPIQQAIKVLKAEKTILKLLKEFMIERVPIEKAVPIILNAKNKQEIKDYIKEHNYLNRNIMLDPLKASDEYTVYRKVFDATMKKQGRISQNKIIQLIEKCIKCKIKKGKEREIYVELLNELTSNKEKYNELKEICIAMILEKDIPKEKGVSKAHLIKLLKPLKMIYNLMIDKDGYIKITSLK